MGSYKWRWFVVSVLVAFTGFAGLVPGGPTAIRMAFPNPFAQQTTIVLALSQAAVGFGTTALIVHVIPYLEGNGISKTAADGNYVYYGVREFGMGALMNGLCLHGGVIPYGGTFLVFSDYARNAVRMSALMGIGMLMLFRHRTSLGGINILALYLQDKHGLRAGFVQLGIDAVILLIALPLALCIHRLVLKRRNLQSLFKRSDFNMPSMRALATGGKGGDYTVLMRGDAAAPIVDLLTDDNRLPETAGLARVRVLNGLNQALTLNVNYGALAGGTTGCSGSCPALPTAATTTIPRRAASSAAWQIGSCW